MGVIIYLTSPYFASYIPLITQELNPVMLILIGALLGIMMSIDLEDLLIKQLIQLEL